MKLRQLGLAAAAVGLMGSAHAAVVNFNDPGVIDVDNNTGVATYTEASFAVTGQGADFLTLDGALVGGFFGAAPFSLAAVGGGLFSLQSLDYAFFDLGETVGDLFITGLLGTQAVASLSLPVAAGTAATFSFGTEWAPLSAVSFSGSAGFALDNINLNAVPEPATALLVGRGLAGVLVGRRK